MTESERKNKARQICLELDPIRSPEAIAFFKDHMDEEISAYDLATALVRCDKTQSLPKVLFDFIVELYQEAAAEDNPAALNDLGALYYDGRGCEQDFTKAVFYYEKAAKLGNRQAQENLGYCYYYGRNMPVDYKKAFHFFALGAFDGHLISLYKIGDMYQNGYYVEKNPTEAFNIYERCLFLMTVESAPVVAGPVFLRLGNCFLEGNGVEKNAKTALVCFQNAEVWLYDMVAGGNAMYKKSLQAAIDGQSKAIELMNEKLPDKQWLVGGKD